MVATVPGRFSTGVINAGGAVKATECVDVIRAELAAFQAPGGQQAWTEYDVITVAGNARDMIMMSRGDPLLQDRRIYCHLAVISGSQFRTGAVGDWSTVSHTARNEETFSAFTGLPSTTNQITWYATVNEYAAMFIWDQAGTIRFSIFGQVNRSHIGRAHRGTCFSTAAVVAGSSVVIPVDRDMTLELVAGRQVDIIPLTNTGLTLPGTFVPERCTLTAVGATSVTVATLAGNQPSYCIIGDDPSPTYGYGGATSIAAPGFSFRRNVAVLTSPTYAVTAMHLNVGESNCDPDAGSMWLGAPSIVTSSTDGFRGTLFHAAAWPTDGTQSVVRHWRHDLDDRQAWVQFPGITIGSSGFVLGWRDAVIADVQESQPQPRASSPTFRSGTIAAGGAIKMQEFITLIRDELLAHPSNAWELYQDQGAGGGTIARFVMRSRGAGGETYVYTRLTAATGGASVTVETYLDWSTNSSTGRNIQTSSFNGSNTTQLDWVLAIHEYGFALNFTQGANTRHLVAGQSFRSHIPNHHRGCALSTGAVTSGASVVIPVDRDLRGELKVGGRVDIVPMATDGGALPTFNKERQVVTAVTASAVTVATLTNNQPANCLIGDDPVPMYLVGFSSGSFGPLFNLARTGTGTGGVGTSDVFGFTEAANDPDTAGAFFGFRHFLSQSVASLRGVCDLLAVWPDPGGTAVGDTFLDGDSLTFWRVLQTTAVSGYLVTMRQDSATGTQRLGTLLDMAHGQRVVDSGLYTASATYDDGVFMDVLSALEAPVTPSSGTFVAVVRQSSPVLTSAAADGAGGPDVDRLGGDGVVLITDADLINTDRDQALLGLTLPAGWATTGTGSVRSTRAGLELVSSMAVIVNNTYQSFDVRVDVELLTPKGGVTGPVELAVLEVVIGTSVARVVVQRGVGLDGTIAIGQIGTLGYGTVTVDPSRKMTLRLVRDAAMIWGFVEQDDVRTRVLAGVVGTVTGVFRLAARNLATGVRLVSRFTNYRVTSAAMIGLELLDDGEVIGLHQLAGTAPAHTLGATDVTIFGLFGRVVQVNGATYSAASTRVVAPAGSIVVINDAAIGEPVVA